MPKYKLLMGQHIQNNKEGKEVTYKAGDKFFSDSNLEKFNSPGHTPKFERLQDDAYVGEDTVQPTTPESFPPPASTVSIDQTLASMSFADMKKFALEEEIDLSKAKNREDALKIIKAAMTD